MVVYCIDSVETDLNNISTATHGSVLY